MAQVAGFGGPHRPLILGRFVSIADQVQHAVDHVQQLLGGGRPADSAASAAAVSALDDYFAFQVAVVFVERRS